MTMAHNSALAPIPSGCLWAAATAMALGRPAALLPSLVHSPPGELMF